MKRSRLSSVSLRTSIFKASPDAKKSNNDGFIMGLKKSTKTNLTNDIDKAPLEDGV